MSLFKPIKLQGRVSIAICPRCSTKVYYDDLRKDPNTQSWYCPECVDAFDPYRLPARGTEDISLRHQRNQLELELGDECTALGRSSICDMAVADCSVCNSEIH